MVADTMTSFELGMPAFVPAPREHRSKPPAPREVIGLRQADRADRGRIAEISNEVVCGGDQLPRHFDDWLDADDGKFMVAEVAGRLAAMYRAVPAADGVLWYEGLRVAPEFRGRAVGRSLVEMAASAGSRRGYTEMRLHAGPESGLFFQSVGFTALVQVARWDADPSRRGRLPTVLAPEHSDTALGWLRQDDAFNRYPGMKPVFGRSADGDRRNVNSLARDGILRFSGELPSFAAVAAVRPTETEGPLRVTFLAGTGEGVYDLLHGIRHQAHVEGAKRVRVVAPVDHPCAPELEAAGFAVRDDFRLTVYSRPLVEAPPRN